jgi:uncharacterized protein involved in exopolysaccharide biosynthesis
MLGADMSESTDTRDRVIKLESDLKHLTDSVESMSHKVTDMHDLLNQARGARWLILTAAAIGGFVSAKVAAFVPWLSFPPR